MLAMNSKGYTRTQEAEICPELYNLDLQIAANHNLQQEGWPKSCDLLISWNFTPKLEKWAFMLSWPFAFTSDKYFFLDVDYVIITSIIIKMQVMFEREKRCGRPCNSWASLIRIHWEKVIPVERACKFYWVLFIFAKYTEIKVASEQRQSDIKATSSVRLTHVQKSQRSKIPTSTARVRLSEHATHWSWNKRRTARTQVHNLEWKRCVWICF